MAAAAVTPTPQPAPQRSSTTGFSMLDNFKQ
jgi:hypothetical protein